MTKLDTRKTPSRDVFQRQADEVRGIIGDYPIVEAKTDFLVYVNLEDQKEGLRGNANQCMFSKACKRAFGSRAVLFYPSIAYVDTLDEDGNRIVLRFSLPKKTRERLEMFDLGEGEAVREATFVLKAVPKGSRLNVRRNSKRKYKKAIKTGDKTVDPGRSARAKAGHETRRNAELLGIRRGVGQVHRSA